MDTHGEIQIRMMWARDLGVMLAMKLLGFLPRIIIVVRIYPAFLVSTHSGVVFRLSNSHTMPLQPHLKQLMKAHESSLGNETAYVNGHMMNFATQGRLDTRDWI